MQHLDLKVIERALEWGKEGETLWFCTVLSTFGSSPREPGSWLVARSDGQHIGSLSGGCVEEDFLERLQGGEFDRPVTTLLYGDPEGPQGPRISLPCGGILEVLIERLPPNTATLTHCELLRGALVGQRHLVRCVDPNTGEMSCLDDEGVGPRVERDSEGRTIRMRVGPAVRLIIAGISPVSTACAEFACALGFEVIVCEPREEVRLDFNVSGVELRSELPSLFIRSGACHAATAVVALTHDPRIDDLAMVDAVRTSAFYIGVMGSKRTSKARADRLRRSGGLTDEELDRLHMPIGLALGSKTPAEIALAVMADILRVKRGRSRELL